MKNIFNNEMNEWEEHLAAAGCRVTAPRRAVMHVLKGTDEPLSPQEIREQAQAIHHRLGLVTVYRTLDLLMELNLVRRIHCENGCHGYLPSSQGHYHAIICRQCGRAVEFPGKNDLNAYIARVEARTGYQIDDHLLQFFGLCAGCQETIRQRSAGS
jgi:Fe2+ or Zn2+ uptake regulation protein